MAPPPIYNWSPQTPVLLKLKKLLILIFPTAYLRLVFQKICIYEDKVQEAYLWKSHKFVPADLEICDPKI